MLSQIKQKLTNLKSKRTKQEEERNFWVDELTRYIKWYNGELDELYSLKPPTKQQKIVVSNIKDSAILTWLDLHQKPKYLADLQLPKNAFAGQKLLDVGAGPLPSALAFSGVDLYCLDQLYADYLAAGYPIHYYENTHFICASSEAIPVEDNFFDAVISVNAIDHVDDLHKTAQEICRVLKPNGKFAMHVHYHKATPIEPLEITDKSFLSEFDWCKGLKKVSESNKKTGWTAGEGEFYVVWRNF